MKTQLRKPPHRSYGAIPDVVCAYSIEKIIEAFDDREDWVDVGRRIVDGAREFYSTPIKVASSIADMDFAVQFSAKSPVSISTANDTLTIKATLRTPIGDIGGSVKTPIGGSPPATVVPDSSNSNPIPDSNNGGG